MMASYSEESVKQYLVKRIIYYTERNPGRWGEFYVQTKLEDGKPIKGFRTIPFDDATISDLLTSTVEELFPLYERVVVRATKQM